ncbi:hypothetical protein ACPF04_06775 [Campylobacter sp. MOP51]|uniref:hypothetical protein n=1 Tax=Campylobacter canis TaxID=3378588 RepID=UPI003C49CAD1
MKKSIKYNFKDERDFESFFKKFAEVHGLDFSDEMHIDLDGYLTYGTLRRFAEAIGFSNTYVLLSFYSKIMAGQQGYLDTFFINLVFINKVDLKDEKYIYYIPGAHEINLESDGTLRFWYD